MTDKILKIILVFSVLLGLPLFGNFKERELNSVDLEVTSAIDPKVVLLDTSTATTSVIRYKNIFFTWDPYEGNYIEYYHFVMDDGNIWEFSWTIYEIHKLNLVYDEEIEVLNFNDENFVMLAPTEDGSIKHILFVRWNGRYQAIQVLNTPEPQPEVFGVRPAVRGQACKSAS